MHLNSNSQEQKYMEINLTTYKLIIKKSLSMLYFKPFIENKGSRSDLQHYIYMKKMV